MQIDGRTILFTGDSRGDDLVDGLNGSSMDDGTGEFKIDILKVPHHASSRNLTRDFFQRVIADHYIISADGKYGNPSKDVLRWIVETQGTRGYEIHLTYGEGNGAAEYLEELRGSSMHYEVRAGRPGVGLSVTL